MPQQELSMDLGLAFIPETANPIIFQELYVVYNAIKILAATLDSYTGVLTPDEELWPTVGTNNIFSQNANRIYVPFSETVTAGQLVTLYNNAGQLTAKLCGGVTWAGDCRGYMSLANTVSPGNYGQVTLFGLHPLVSGLTPGTIYYSSNTTAGSITSTVPISSGENKQPIGFALSTGQLFFNPTLVSEVIP